MAATSTKPSLSALKTPASATFPSELRSPMVGTPGIKREESEKTPITPPAAYLDFLKALSPALMTPLPSGASSRFSFGLGERPASASTTSTATPPTSAGITTDKPVTTRSRSSSSDRSASNCNCGDSKPDMKINIPPPSPFARPVSARTPRRLYIPQSPYSPGTTRSPRSAHTIHSPWSATASPRDWDFEKGKPTSTKVSVRQVVTRTVTYSRTPIEAPAPLDPAPRGKRRRIE